MQGARIFKVGLIASW